MHALLFPFGSSGDVYPFVGLGLALQQRGHAVTLVTNGYFREMIERVGLDYVELTTREEFLQLVTHPDLWHPLRSAAFLFREAVPRFLRRQYEYIRQHARPGETVVVSNCLGVGARIAQEHLGVPLVTVHLQPAVLWSEYDSPKLGKLLVGSGVPRWLKRLQYWLGERLFIDSAACPPINAFRSELGLPPMRRTTQWWNSTECVLGMFPEWYAPLQPDWPPNIRLTQFPLWDEPDGHPMEPELETFLAAGDRPVVFTPGTANLQAADFFATAVEVCRQVPCRGLLVTQFAEQVPACLPSTVRHLSYAPFAQLLPRAAAIVHHGGVGTLAQALRAGIPQLIMPLSHDQPDNAHRLSRFGVGDSLPPAQFKVPAATEKLRQLLESGEVASACANLASRFERVDPFAESCHAIEQFVSAPSGQASGNRSNFT